MFMNRNNMSIPDNFATLYKTISNAELLDILENPDDFQPLAVEAASIEFKKRNLSAAEIEIAKEILRGKTLEKERQKENLKKIENSFRSTGQTLLDTLNPIQEGTVNIEKTIRFIVISFAVFFLYNLLSNWKLIIFYIRDFSYSPLGSLFVLFPFLILPIALPVFLKRKPLGWLLLVILLSYLISGEALGLFHSLSWRPSGIQSLDAFLSKPSPVRNIIRLAALLGILYIFCRAVIRDIYKIPKSRMITTIILTTLLTFILSFIII